MSLTDTAIRQAKPRSKAYKLFDGGGLYLEVAPSGGKWWRYKYRFFGKEKRISLGTYPTVSLKEVRFKHADARKLLASGIDPSEMKKVAVATAAGRYSFEGIAMEWVALRAPGWSPSHCQKTKDILKRDLLPFLGSRHIGEIKPAELLAVLKRIDQRSSATARKAYSICKQVFIYAIPTGHVLVSPAEGLHAHLSPRLVKHMAAPASREDTARLMQAIDGYQGTFVVYCALRLSSLFFVRPGTLRAMEWADIDFDLKEWRVPIEQLKRRQVDKEARKGKVAHIVPLCRQALEILRELRQLTGGGTYAFPSTRQRGKCMSNNAVRAALRSMGFTGDEITPHGFRHMASTHLHELGYPSHLIEKQLAHADSNKIRAVYNHAEYLPERRKMMQEWADYLDRLKEGGGG